MKTRSGLNFVEVIFMVDTSQFNVLEHDLVPEHRLLSDEEAEEGPG